MRDARSTEEECRRQPSRKISGAAGWIVVFVVAMAGFVSDVATIMEGVLKITRYFGYII